MSKHGWLLCGLTCLFAAGCDDLPTDQAAEAGDPVEAAARSEVSPLPDFSFEDEGSTVCSAYRDRLFELQSRLGDDDAEEPLRQEATTFESLLRHSCQ